MVRVGFPGAPRLDWYDRNPLTKSAAYLGSNTAPHGGTDRTQYTVPTGKKAIIQAVQLHTRRVTAATTAGQVSLVFFVTAAGASMRLLQIMHFDNTVNSIIQKSLGVTLLLQTGHQLTGTTSDASTGGTNDLNLDSCVTEYDA